MYGTWNKTFMFSLALRQCHGDGRTIGRPQNNGEQNEWTLRKGAREPLTTALIDKA